jgi:sulfofructose kinase
VVVGRAAVDYLYRIEAFPDRPTKLMALDHQTNPGGMAANAATAVARLGGHVEMWSRVGDDRAGAELIDDLQQEGVRTPHIRTFASVATATAVIIVDNKGERMVIGEPGLDFPMDAEWLPTQTLNTTDIVFSDMNWREGTLAAFEAARRVGATTLLDIDIGVGQLPNDVIALTDYAIFANSAMKAFVDGRDHSQRLSRLIEMGVKYAGVTQGNEGYKWKNAAGETGQQAAFVVDVVDTTGAGDAFHGAFAWALANNMNEAQCARIASAVAALKCRRLGTRDGLPDIAELESFLRSETGRGIEAETD